MAVFLDKYTKISTTEDMESFLSQVGNFHDGVLKEAHILNSAFVTEDLSTSCNFKYDMRLLVQRQWNSPSAVEIILGNVTELKLTESEMIWTSWGTVEKAKNDESIKISLSLDQSVFSCCEMYWRDASEWMGKNSRFGDYLCLETLQPYEVLEEGWVICSNCCEAWQPGKSVIIQCPNCSGVYNCGVSKRPVIMKL